MTLEFTLSIRLPALPIVVYNAWLNSETHSKMTGGDAIASDQVGDEFKAYDEYIWGRNLELVHGKKIVQSWRTTEFKKEDPDSILEVNFEEDNGTTMLQLKHSNLSKDGDRYRQGWIDHYFEPMKEYFHLL